MKTELYESPSFEIVCLTQEKNIMSNTKGSQEPTSERVDYEEL